MSTWIKDNMSKAWLLLLGKTDLEECLAWQQTSHNCLWVGWVILNIWQMLERVTRRIPHSTMPKLIGVTVCDDSHWSCRHGLKLEHPLCNLPVPIGLFVVRSYNTQISWEKTRQQSALVAKRETDIRLIVNWGTYNTCRRTILGASRTFPTLIAFVCIPLESPTGDERYLEC